MRGRRTLRWGVRRGLRTLVIRRRLGLVFTRLRGRAWVWGRITLFTILMMRLYLLV